MSVDEHTIELAGSPVFYRTSAAPGVPAVYLHGVPTSSDDWVELLARTGGLAPDLIGFGRSGKGGQLVYTVESLADFVEPLLPDRVKLVGHDWGALVALELAARQPGRAAALALVNPLPLLSGFGWPAPASWWRRPLVGELLMGATTKAVLRRALRKGEPAAWPDERVERAWAQFDQGTQRAILRLHRHTDTHWLERARERLGRLDAPTLIVWGEQDPWLPPGLAPAVAALLGDAMLEPVPGGHWPWLGQPAVRERLAVFVERA